MAVWYIILDSSCATNDTPLTFFSHVGHFVFTNGLLPLLKNAAAKKDADVRVITLTSSAVTDILTPGYQFDFTTPSFLSGKLPYEPWLWRFVGKHIFTFDMLPYSLAKAANLLFAQELQRRFDVQGIPIISQSVHPGFVKSDMSAPIFISPLRPVTNRLMIGAEQGAFNSLFAATAKEVRQNAGLYKGKYLLPVGKLGTKVAVAENQKQISGLWNNTTVEVNKYLAGRGLDPLLEW